MTAAPITAAAARTTIAIMPASPVEGVEDSAAEEVAGASEEVVGASEEVVGASEEVVGASEEVSASDEVSPAGSEVSPAGSPSWKVISVIPMNSQTTLSSVASS